jgi:hypothetical protein
VSNYGPISVNNFTKVFEVIIHDNVLLYVKRNPNHHGFTKSNFTVISLVTFRDFMTPLVRSHRHADAVCFGLSNTFDLFPNNMILHKLSCFGFFDGYLSWFYSYLTNRQSRVRVSGNPSLPFQVTSGVHLLFNVFINDLCNSVNHLISIGL